MRNFFVSLLKFFGLVIVVALAGWYIGFLNQVNEIKPVSQPDGSVINQPIRRFPELQSPKEIDFQWTSAKKPYSLKITLYKTVYDFYQSSPKEFSYSGNLPTNWEESYYEMFIRQNPIDKTITELTAQLESLALRNRLNSDQTVDLVTNFVQSIPYDFEKASAIKQNPDSVKQSYPYEVLYEQKGVCSDKSFLLTAILREMGYGTALLEYKSENHLAVGISCPLEYSNYNSGYCYAETTQSGHKIGVIPDLETKTNNAVVKEEMTPFGTDTNTIKDIKKLDNPQFFQKKEGKMYNGIILTIKIQTQIVTLEKEITDLKSQLLPLKDQINQEGKIVDDFSKKMADLKKAKDYKNYNGQVTDYNKQLNDYKKKVSDYNLQVNNYNQKVNEYNNLIKNQ